MVVMMHTRGNGDSNSISTGVGPLPSPVYIIPDAEKSIRYERDRGYPGAVPLPYSSLFLYEYKIILMQLVATVSLLIAFIINYNLNPEYTLFLSIYSPAILAFNPIVAGLLGVILGFMIHAYTNLSYVVQRIIKISFIIVAVLFFGAGPLATLAWTSDWEAAGYTFAETLVAFAKFLIVLLYLSPAMFGMFGIWSKNRIFIGVSSLLLLLISTTTPNPIMEIPTLIVFAVALFYYIEFADSAVTYSRIGVFSVRESRNPQYALHFNRILYNYFIAIIVISIIVLIILGIIINYESIFGALSSEQVLESIELSSIYGMAIFAVVTLVITALVGIILMYEPVLRLIVASVLKPPLSHAR
jgi:hypothetical protein